MKLILAILAAFALTVNGCGKKEEPPCTFEKSGLSLLIGDPWVQSQTRRMDPELAVVRAVANASARDRTDPADSPGYSRLVRPSNKDPNHVR